MVRAVETEIAMRVGKTSGGIYLDVDGTIGRLVRPEFTTPRRGERDRSLFRSPGSF